MKFERRLVLLGDSILDNAPYTRPEPDTTDHLRRLLAPEWSVERRARDGAIMSDVRGQLRALEGRPSVAVLSVGGNDALEHVGLLDRGVTSSVDLLDDLVTIGDAFGERYESVARAVTERAERTVLCTIYEVRLEPARYARLARAPLAVLNDQIIRIGGRLGLEILELRSICTDADDFVLQIEPSARGAARIAHAIAALVRGDPALHPSRLWHAAP